jgi:hypothetical protein
MTPTVFTWRFHLMPVKVRNCGFMRYRIERFAKMALAFRTEGGIVNYAALFQSALVALLRNKMRSVLWGSVSGLRP